MIKTKRLFLFILFQIQHIDFLLRDTGLTGPSVNIDTMTTLFKKIFQEKIYKKIKYYNGMQNFKDAYEMLLEGTSKGQRTEYHEMFFSLLAEWRKCTNDNINRTEIIGKICDLLAESDHIGEVAQKFRVGKENFIKIARRVWFERCETQSDDKPCLFQHYYLGHISETGSPNGIHGWDGIIYLSTLETYNCYLTTLGREIYSARIVVNDRKCKRSTFHIGLPFDFEMLLITVLAVYAFKEELPIDLGRGTILFKYSWRADGFSNVCFADEK